MAPPRSPRPISLSLSLAVCVLAAASAAWAFEEVDNDRCDCFLTNGSTASYFSGHKFFDFRSLSEYAGVPAYIDDAYKSSYVEPASEYFKSEEWTDTWGVQGWNNSASLAAGVASVLMVHSPNNVYIEANRNQDQDSASPSPSPSPSPETFLTLRTIRLQDFQSSAEFESVDHGYQFVSMRMYARTLGAPGAITAMFTYRGEVGGELAAVQEADLEVRTLDPPGVVQCTNQPAYTDEGVKIDKATRNVTIPGGSSSSSSSSEGAKRTRQDWAVYRMDWTPRDTTWFIDGAEVASIEFQAPRDPSILMFNSWSDGGNWTGNMTVGAEAYLNLQWIELVYNTTTTAAATAISEKRDEDEGGDNSSNNSNGDSCYNVCSVDETDTVGTPVLLQGGASSLLPVGPARGFENVVAAWIPWLAMAVAASSTTWA
ncbi:hypothetical protein SLS62_008450 [Diatrype stigma]|uniref:GH16 domain-containing protein n=1 Tax=Diatrype stigma TaxID=117547 RepID=A0AAN9UJF6_9PEZI